MPTVSIIIVSFNAGKCLDECLNSINKASLGVQVEVIVVDNHSTEDIAGLVKEKYPAVHFIQNTVNLGFAKACNQGLNKSGGEYILFLNPDTIVGEGVLDKCIEFMQAHTDAGGLGVRMINPKGKYLRESKRGFPTIKASFGKMLGLYRLFPHSQFFSAYYMGHLPEYETNVVDVLSGAFLMMPADLAKRLGGFDERFFMYAEDIDLSYRIIQSGYKNYYYPEVTITHLKGESTPLKSAVYTHHFYGAMAKYIDKHYAHQTFKRTILKLLVFVAKGLAHVKRMIVFPARVFD